jgi:hypothetical protein
VRVECPGPISVEGRVGVMILCLMTMMISEEPPYQLSMKSSTGAAVASFSACRGES